MALTLTGYIENPMGKKNAVFSNRDMYRDLYTKKFDMVLLRENGNINYKLYTKGSNYYIHLKIPSEVVPRFAYDVVIEFYTDDEATSASRSLMNYSVRFYSNDPSFVFTYCKAFVDNDLFIKQLEPKMSRKAITDIAAERNPKEIVGYVKSLYFAYLWIKNKSLLNKTVFDSYATKLVWSDFLKLIEHADDKIAARQQAGALIDKEKRKQKEEEKQRKLLNKKDIEHAVSVAGTVSKTKTVNKVSSSKTVKKAKTIKKI